MRQREREREREKERERERERAVTITYNDLHTSGKEEDYMKKEDIGYICLSINLSNSCRPRGTELHSVPRGLEPLPVKLWIVS